MRSLNSSVVTALAAETARAFWLLEMQFTSTYYYTNADIDIVSGGNRYSKLAFEVSDIHQSVDFSIDRLTVTMQAVDLVINAVVLNEDIANDPVILSYILLDADHQEIGAPQYFAGFVLSWDLIEKRFSMSLGNEFMLWRKRTLRLPTDSCPWVFKGTECTYAGGETWCDQSVERCKALSNFDDFGGRRYILSLEDKKVYWGEK